MVGEEGDEEDDTILVRVGGMEKVAWWWGHWGVIEREDRLIVYCLEKSMNDDMPLLTCHLPYVA